MRNSIPNSGNNVVQAVWQRFLYAWRSRAKQLNEREMLGPIILIPAFSCAMLPVLIFILPYSSHPIVYLGLMAFFSVAVAMSLMALRKASPGYLIMQQHDSPMHDADTLEILHRWYAKYPTFIRDREIADETLEGRTPAGLTTVPLASGVHDPSRKDAIATIMARISAASKSDEDGGAQGVKDGAAELAALVSITPTIPKNGYSLSQLPPPPSRPHFVSPVAHKHPVVDYDKEKVDAAEAASMLGLPSDRQERRARKRAKKAREEALRYETRRKDYEFAELDRQAALEDPAAASCASATEEEEETMRSRAPPQSYTQNGASSVPAGMPNPFANADNFFKHDFNAHPIDEKERAALTAQARDTGAAAANGGRPAPTDEFFVGNPRWHPAKLKDDMDRFAMDEKGLREEFCLDCMVWRPLGSRHCHRCQLCSDMSAGHNPLLGTCISGGNMRFLLLFQFFLFLLAVVNLYMSYTVIKEKHIFTWSSWRVQNGGFQENGTPTYTWAFLLFAQVGIFLAWVVASIATFAFLNIPTVDLVKHANYVSMAEGAGLRAEAPVGRMRMNPLQLMLYADIGEVLRVMFERVLFAPITWMKDSYAHAREAREKARERRKEWRAIREEHEAEVAAKMAQTNPNAVHSMNEVSLGASLGAPVSPHHAVEVRH